MTTKGFFKGCAIGCGITTLIVVVAVIGFGLRFSSGFNEADGARRELEELYGATHEYVPAPDGAVSMERLAVFLAVREELIGHCGEFADGFDQLEHMDEIEDDTPKLEVLKGVSRAMGGLMGHISYIGKYLAARNHALLANGMGLGEYTYIYVLGYYSVLQNSRDEIERRTEDHAVSSRARRDLRTMLKSQLAALIAAGAAEEARAALQDEIDRLHADEDRLPWEDGPPEAIAAGFAPYLEDLVRLWCLDTAPFEVQIIEKKAGGLSYHGH